MPFSLEETIGKIQSFKSSREAPLEGMVNLIEESYQCLAANSRKWNFLCHELTKESLDLLDLGEQEKLNERLEENNKGLAGLRRVWSENLLYLSTQEALFNEKPEELAGVLLEYLALEQPFLAQRTTPTHVKNLFYSLGKIAESGLIRGEGEYPQLQEQINSFPRESLSYLLPGEEESGKGLEEVVLEFKKPATRHLDDILSSELEYIFNCFLAASDFSRNSPREQAEAFLVLGRLTKLRREIPFYIKFHPKLNNVKKLLEKRLGNNHWDALAGEFFLKSYQLLQERIEDSQKNNHKVSVKEMGTYCVATLSLLETAPEKADFSLIKNTLSDWKPPPNQPIYVCQTYARLFFELARREEDSTEKLSLLKKAIRSSRLAMNQATRKGESYVPLYWLTAQINDYIADEKIEGDWMDENSELVYPEKTIKLGSYRDFLQGKTRKELVRRLQEDNIFSSEGVTLKRKVAFIPQDEHGQHLWGIVSKRSKNREEIKERYFLEQAIYQTLKDEGPEEEPLFVQPLDLIEMEIGGEKEYFYLMRRGGHSLAEKMSFLGWQSSFLDSLLSENKISKEQEEEIRQEKRKIASARNEEIQTTLKNLARFHRVLTQRWGDAGKISDSVEIVDRQGNTSEERVEYALEPFDYLENLIERAFVKSSDPRSQQKVKELATIIRKKDQASFNKLDKLDFFRTRIPYSPKLYDFLVAYNQFIEKHFSDRSSDVVLHCDAHLENTLEGGILIDNKPLKKGHPFVDVSHLLEDVALDFLDRKEEFVENYLLKMGFNHLIKRKRFFPGYSSHVIHNCLCLVGANSNQGRTERAKKFLKKALKLLRIKYLLDIIDGQYNTCLFPCLVNYISETGQKDLLEALKETGSRRYLPKKRTSQKLRIGVDFDGVIADATELKIELFGRKGYNLRPQDCSKKKAAGRNLPEEEYEKEIERMYASEQFLRAKPVPYAKKALSDLLDSGHEIYLVTSRHDDAREKAEEWLKSQEIPYSKLINTRGQPKDKICEERELDLLIDDGWEKLESITGKTRPILFNAPWNQEDDVPIPRMYDWRSIYTVINALQLDPTSH